MDSKEEISTIAPGNENCPESFKISFVHRTDGIH